jgi:hypothetical protein
MEIKEDEIRIVLRSLRKIGTKLRKNDKRKKKEEKLFCI